MTPPPTCPACHEPLPPPAAAGAPVRCPKCEGAPAARPKSRGWGGVLLLGVVALAAAGGVAYYFVFTRSEPTDFAEPGGVFTARFPNPPTTVTVTEPDISMLKMGERVTTATAAGTEYAVAVLEGLNGGDQEVSPAACDKQANVALVLLATNVNGDAVHQRAATHDGHAGREVVIAARDGGRLTAVRLVVGERAGVRMTVTGSGDRANPAAFLATAAAFFDTVRIGPAFGPPVVEPVAVTAADLAAAYRADAKAADARFKDRWVRVTGPVTEVAADGKSFTFDAGGTTVTVQRAPRGRLSVPIRKDAGPVTATGKCLGAADPAAPPRVALAEAFVPRPPPAPAPQ